MPNPLPLTIVSGIGPTSPSEELTDRWNYILEMCWRF